MSWENIFKVKVQGSTLRLLLVGSIPGFRVLSTPGWQMTGTVVLSFFYFSTASKLTSAPDVFLNEACVTLRPTHDNRHPCGLFTHPGRKTNTRLSDKLWFWPC